MYNNISDGDLNCIRELITLEAFHITEHFDFSEAITQRCFNVTNYRTPRLGIKNGSLGDPLDVFQKIEVACDVEVFAGERTIALKFSTDAFAACPPTTTGTGSPASTPRISE
jgi:hypothetical protein